MEVLARSKPAIVTYRPDMMNYVYGKAVVTIKYMSLINLMVDRELIPEFLYVFDVKKNAARMHTVIGGWLRNPIEMQAMASELDALRNEIVQVGGVGKAADTILKLLGQQHVERVAA